MRGDTSGSSQRLEEFLRKCATEGKLANYPEAARVTGLRVGPPLFEALKEVQLRQDILGCDLSALVVSATSGLPGKGWGDLARWDDAVRECYGCFSEREIQAPVAAFPETSVTNLPYAPGNAGDLLKHAGLASVVRWQLSKSNNVFQYADAFAGEWDYSLLSEVIERTDRLEDIALARYSHEAWQQGRYLGSTGLVAAIASAEHRMIELWVGDQVPERVDRLVKLHGCHQLPQPQDGYAVLDDNRAFDLILLDPFKEFLGKAPELLPQIIAKTSQSSLLLFLLSKEAMPENYVKFDNALQQEFHARKATALSASITALTNPRVAGEKGYLFELLFLPRQDLAQAAISELLPMFSAAAVRVAAALGEGGEARVRLLTP